MTGIPQYSTQWSMLTNAGKRSKVRSGRDRISTSRLTRAMQMAVSIATGSAWVRTVALVRQKTSTRECAGVMRSELFICWTHPGLISGLLDFRHLLPFLRGFTPHLHYRQFRDATGALTAVCIVQRESSMSGRNPRDLLGQQNRERARGVSTLTLAALPANRGHDFRLLRKTAPGSPLLPIVR